MKYFLDSAKIDEIRYAYECWGINGVTTNPRHIMASGKGFYAVIEELAREFDGKEFPISVEVNPHLENSAEIVDAAVEIAAISESFCIKVPCTEPGLIAARRLEERGIRTNVTLVFSATQALQAARLGARFCSPFVGWRDANGDEGLRLIETVMDVFHAQHCDTEVIVAAVRTAAQIISSAKLGAHIVTAGMDVYRESFAHPYTAHGLSVFRNAWDQTDTERAIEHSPRQVQSA